MLEQLSNIEFKNIERVSVHRCTAHELHCSGLEVGASKEITYNEMPS